MVVYGVNQNTNTDPRHGRHAVSQGSSQDKYFHWLQVEPNEWENNLIYVNSVFRLAVIVRPRNMCVEFLYL